VAIFDQFKSLLGDIGDELGTLGKEIGAIGQSEVQQFKGNPGKYLRDSARDLTRMGICFPILEAIGGETPRFFDEAQLPVATPVEGSILYVDLIGEHAQHSGIYIGNGEIAELSGKGRIQRVNREQFICGGTGSDIYVSCWNNAAIGSPAVAQRARRQLGSRRNYNIVLNNCHQFCAGCLSGNFENSDNFLWMLKHSAKTTLGADSWRLWG